MILASRTMNWFLIGCNSKNICKNDMAFENMFTFDGKKYYVKVEVIL